MTTETITATEVAPKVNFIEFFKEKARNHNISINDVIIRCAYKAIHAKAENNEEVFYGLLRKAFTPGQRASHRPCPYWTVALAVNPTFWILRGTYNKTYIAMFEPEELEAIRKLIQSLDHRKI